MVDTGSPWTCAACGAGNAGYRKRCIDCSAKRSVAAVEAEPAGPSEPVGRVDLADIPLPRIAKRPRRRLGRAPALALAVAVLGLAGYGATTYVTADRPSGEDDEAALRAAAPEVFDGALLVAEGGLADDLVDAAAGAGCLDASIELLRLVDSHATVSLDVDGDAGVVAMHVFDTRPAAVRFDDGLRAAALEGCAPDLGSRHWVVTGRARIEVRGVGGSEADALLARLVERLEIEG